MIRVLIIDSEELMGQGLQAVLAKDELINSSVMKFNPEQVLKKIGHFYPDIALFCVDSFEITIMEQLRLIKHEFPYVKVLLLQSTYNEQFVIEGLRAGIDGFLLDDTDPERLLQSIHDINEKHYVLSGKFAKIIMDQFQAMFQNERQQLWMNLMKRQIRLSHHELDVLYLIMKDYKNKGIASSLNLKEKTIRDYISNSYKKIGINNRKEVAAYLREMMGRKI